MVKYKIEDNVTVVFNNADAKPKSQVVHVHPDSLEQVMEWYGAFFIGDRYTVTVDGRKVPLDINGGPKLGGR